MRDHVEHGSASRLGGFGLPLVVSDTGWFRELPDTFATMDAVVGGPIQVESRQAWNIRYTVTPSA